jgi:hypothetical protein
MSYFSQISIVNLFILLSVISIAASIFILFVVHRLIPLDMRYKDDGVIGNISQSISIVYGVLVGVIALYLINNISYIDDAVQHEAHAIANVYHDILWVKEPTRSAMQNDISNYLEVVINKEWPLMKRGETISREGESYIDKLAATLREYSVNNKSDSEIIFKTYEDITSLYDARHQRIHMSFSALSPEVWVVILISTFLMIGINYFFGVNFYMHVVSVAAVALMTSSMFFLLVSLDKPFQGEFVIESDSFKSILTEIKNTKALTETKRVIHKLTYPQG